MRSGIKFSLFIALLFFAACTEKKPALPYLGNHEVSPENPSDTIFHIVPEFTVTNQDGEIITEKNFKDKIYVANFFFTRCPTICPKMTSQLKRFQELSKDMDIKIISYSIDPKRDTVEALKAYAEKNGISTHNWDFVTGDKEVIYELGMEGYHLSAMEDEEAEGGFLHSQMVVLVDKEKHIRGMYDGTVTEEMDKLLSDIKKLKKEYE